MGGLRDLPNIGKELEKLLAAAGLDTPEKLCAAGTREAFFRVKALDPTACHAKLYAIDGTMKLPAASSGVSRLRYRPTGRRGNKEPQQAAGYNVFLVPTPKTR